MGILVTGPILLTLFWLVVVIWRRGVPIWLVPGECGFCVAVFLLAAVLTDAGGDSSFLGHGTGSPSSGEKLAGTWGFYLFVNSLSGMLWCVVLAAVSLPIILVQAYRRRSPVVLGVPADIL